eukprot:6201518-Pleurochrysis_carterae.AAC.1
MAPSPSTLQICGLYRPEGLSQIALIRPNTGNGGARRRARALLSRRLARPSSGTNRHPQP